jgi:hypothetical protein
MLLILWLFDRDDIFGRHSSGHTETCSRAEHTAQRLGHCHPHELRIRSHVANASMKFFETMELYLGAE